MPDDADYAPLDPFNDDQNIWPGYDPAQDLTAPSPKMDAVSPAPAPASSGPGADPFAAMGGGVMVNGGWVPANHPAAQGATPSPAGGGSPQGQPPIGIQQAFSSALTKLLNGPMPNDVNVNDSPALRSYRAESDRALDRDRAFLAERAAATGTSASGGFETDLQGLRQARNRNVQSFAGAEGARMEEARRGELMQALALALQMGDSEAARGLQRELGLGQLAVSNRNVDLGLDQLGFNYAQLQRQMNLDPLAALFG